MLSHAELAVFHRKLNGKKYDRLPIVFDALGDPVRCKMARVLIKKGERDLSVTDIAALLKISQSSTSQHLKILEITGVVKKRSSGRHRYYTINQQDPVVAALVKAVM